MKEDKLEKYIHSNRSKFDDADPSDEVWNKISDNLEIKSRNKIHWLSIAWQAAAAILIFFTAWYMKDIMNSSHTSLATAVRKNIQLHPLVKIIKQNIEPEQKQITNYAYAITNNTTSVKAQNNDTLPSELIEATRYYAEQISQTRILIMNCASYNTEIGQQVNVEFAQLDTVYKSLSNDLKDNINNSEVLEAMILNYRIRLEILESIMQQLETTADCYEKNKN
ncbi:MAG: hypothetical protein V1904_11745 [Bacteroidota bacterium]